MSNETYVTIIGTVSKDPDFKHTPSGGAVCKLSVVTNARKFNRQSNEWEKKAGKFWDAEAWNQGKALLAENIFNSVKKGDTVILYGELETREFEGSDGKMRKADQVRIEGIGKDLRWHQAHANDVTATSTGGNWGGNEPAAAGGWGNEQEPTW